MAVPSTRADQRYLAGKARSEQGSASADHKIEDAVAALEGAPWRQVLGDFQAAAFAKTQLPISLHNAGFKTLRDENAPWQGDAAKANRIWAD